MSPSDENKKSPSDSDLSKLFTVDEYIESGRIFGISPDSEKVIDEEHTKRLNHIMESVSGYTKDEKYKTKGVAYAAAVDGLRRDLKFDQNSGESLKTLKALSDIIVEQVESLKPFISDDTAKELDDRTKNIADQLRSDVEKLNDKDTLFDILDSIYKNNLFSRDNSNAEQYITGILTAIQDYQLIDNLANGGIEKRINELVSEAGIKNEDSTYFPEGSDVVFDIKELNILEEKVNDIALASLALRIKENDLDISKYKVSLQPIVKTVDVEKEVKPLGAAPDIDKAEVKTVDVEKEVKPLGAAPDIDKAEVDTVDVEKEVEPLDAAPDIDKAEVDTVDVEKEVEPLDAAPEIDEIEDEIDTAGVDTVDVAKEDLTNVKQQEPDNRLFTVDKYIKSGGIFGISPNGEKVIDEEHTKRLSRIMDSVSGYTKDEKYKTKGVAYAAAVDGLRRDLKFDQNSGESLKTLKALSDIIVEQVESLKPFVSDEIAKELDDKTKNIADQLRSDAEKPNDEGTLFEMLDSIYTYNLLPRDNGNVLIRVNNGNEQQYITATNYISRTLAAIRDYQFIDNLANGGIEKRINELVSEAGIKNEDSTYFPEGSDVVFDDKESDILKQKVNDIALACLSLRIKERDLDVSKYKVSLQSIAKTVDVKKEVKPLGAAPEIDAAVVDTVDVEKEVEPLGAAAKIDGMEDDIEIEDDIDVAPEIDEMNKILGAADKIYEMEDDIETEDGFEVGGDIDKMLDAIDAAVVGTVDVAKEDLTNVRQQEPGNRLFTVDEYISGKKIFGINPDSLEIIDEKHTERLDHIMDSVSGYTKDEKYKAKGVAYAAAVDGLRRDLKFDQNSGESLKTLKALSDIIVEQVESLKPFVSDDIAKELDDKTKNISDQLRSDAEKLNGKDTLYDTLDSIYENNLIPNDSGNVKDYITGTLAAIQDYQLIDNLANGEIEKRINELVSEAVIYFSEGSDVVFDIKELNILEEKVNDIALASLALRIKENDLDISKYKVSLQPIVKTVDVEKEVKPLGAAPEIDAAAVDTVDVEKEVEPLGAAPEIDEIEDEIDTAGVGAVDVAKEDLTNVKQQEPALDSQNLFGMNEADGVLHVKKIKGQLLDFIKENIKIFKDPDLDEMMKVDPESVLDLDYREPENDESISSILNQYTPKNQDSIDYIENLKNAVKHYANIKAIEVMQEKKQPISVETANIANNDAIAFLEKVSKSKFVNSVQVNKNITAEQEEAVNVAKKTDVSTDVGVTKEVINIADSENFLDASMKSADFTTLDELKNQRQLLDAFIKSKLNFLKKGAEMDPILLDAIDSEDSIIEKLDKDERIGDKDDNVTISSILNNRYEKNNPVTVNFFNDLNKAIQIRRECRAEEIIMSSRSGDSDDGMSTVTSSSSNSAASIKSSVEFLDRQSEKIIYYPSKEAMLKAQEAMARKGSALSNEASKDVKSQKSESLNDDKPVNNPVNNDNKDSEKANKKEAQNVIDILEDASNKMRDSLLMETRTSIDLRVENLAQTAINNSSILWGLAPKTKVTYEYPAGSKQYKDISVLSLTGLNNKGEHNYKNMSHDELGFACRALEQKAADRAKTMEKINKFLLKPLKVVGMISGAVAVSMMIASGVGAPVAGGLAVMSGIISPIIAVPSLGIGFSGSIKSMACGLLPSYHKVSQNLTAISLSKADVGAKIASNSKEAAVKVDIFKDICGPDVFNKLKTHATNNKLEAANLVSLTREAVAGTSMEHFSDSKLKNMMYLLKNALPDTPQDVSKSENISPFKGSFKARSNDIEQQLSGNDKAKSSNTMDNSKSDVLQNLDEKSKQFSDILKQIGGSGAILGGNKISNVTSSLPELNRNVSGDIKKSQSESGFSR